MSSDYRPLKEIRWPDLFDGRLEKFGVRECVHSDGRRYLTDGRGNLWVYRREDDTVSFTRYASSGAVGNLRWTLEEAFETEIVSEHDPRYWGFETEEEWHQAGVEAGIFEPETA